MGTPGYDKLIEITQGDDADVDLYFRRVPADQWIVSAVLSIKQALTDPNGSALYRVTVTTTDDGNGNIIFADGSADVTGITYRNIGTVKMGTALCHWLLPNAFVASLTPGVDYFYGMQVLER
jgi:hypothetical protein